MKTPDQKSSSKGMKPSTLFQLGLIFSLSVTLVGFEFAAVDITRGKVVTEKMKAVEDETVYDDFEIEKPDVPKENQQEDQPQDNQQNVSTQQQVSTNIQTTQDKKEVSENVGLPDSDTTVIIRDIFKKDTVETPGFFDVVEEMPTYKSLLHIKDKDKRKSETELEMLTNINSKIKYPVMARQTGVQGKVYIQFIVNTSGDITNVTVLRSVHPELDAEAVRVVKSLPKMIPGKQLDKPVNVRYTIPIDYKIKD